MRIRKVLLHLQSQGCRGRMRSERKTSADGVVALDRALQTSRSAAAADSGEASSGVLQAPTLMKFVADPQQRRLRG